MAPALNVRSVDELIAFGKAQPGKLIFGSSAVGTGTHLSGARFAHVAGIKVGTVAFKSASEALLQLLGGRTHYSVLTLVVARPFFDDGKVRALAVLLPTRSPVLPDVPRRSDSGPSKRSNGLRSDEFHGDELRGNEHRHPALGRRHQRTQVASSPAA